MNPLRSGLQARPQGQPQSPSPAPIFVFYAKRTSFSRCFFLEVDSEIHGVTRFRHALAVDDRVFRRLNARRAISTPVDEIAASAWVLAPGLAGVAPGLTGGRTWLAGGSGRVGWKVRVG